MSASEEPAATARPRGEAGFRPDIEGLRGVAVLVVVLFHAGLPVAGGFVGVDVFFVISGFLITGLLLREHDLTGTVSLTRFYARRVRRLLPAAAAVLAVTLGAAYLVLGPLDRAEVMADGASAALSIANVRFALAEGDYFAAVSQPSPFLHFWSLAVEEQFYLVWPALLLVLARGGRRRVPLVLILVLLGSFALNVVVTQVSTSWAFYSLPTRAWQLAAGGLLAAGWTWLQRLPSGPVAVAGWIALLGLVESTLLLSSALPYPGIDAAAPTLFSAVLIVAGGRRLGPGALLSTRPLRWLGRISYSLYLWHWPILVLGTVALAEATSDPTGEAAAEAIGLGARLGLVAMAVIVATLSWRLIEEPFHHGRLSIARPRLVLRLGIATIGLVTALSGALAFGSIRAIDAIALAAAPGPTATPEPSSATPEPSDGAGPSGSPTEPSFSPPPGPTPSPEPTPPPITWDQIPDVEQTTAIALPSDVRPSLGTARKDNESLWRDGCGAQVPVIEPPTCTYGDKNGSLTIALVGDSHAAQWFPAFEALAIARGWRLIPYVKLSCAFIDVPVQHISLKREYTECAAWRDRVIQVLAEKQPDIVVVAMSHRGIVPTRAADKNVTSQGEGIGRAIERLPGQVLVMMDTPRTAFDIPGCIAEHPADVRPCAIERDPSFTDSFGIREAIAAAYSGAGVLDLIPKVCPAIPCQVVRDGMIVYRDNHHLTATFSASLAPALEDALRPYVDAVAAARTGRPG